MAFVSGESDYIGMRQLTAEEIKKEAKRLSDLAIQRNADPDLELAKLYGERNKTNSNFIN